VAQEDGEMKFFASRRAKPIEVSLPAIADLAASVDSLVNGVARQIGFDSAKSGEVAQAVAEACRSVAEHACGNDPNSIFHMIVVPNGRQITVKISDYGTILEFPPQGPSADARFGDISKVMEVEHAQNPAGGNLFTLTKSLD
jgi:anti-sigma regulatory factor (Ser/Thr protein kinase)